MYVCEVCASCFTIMSFGNSIFLIYIVFFLFADMNNSNITNLDAGDIELENILRYSPITESSHVHPQTYIVPIVFSLIFFVGVLGNGTLVLIFLRHRIMRNVPNTYIFSLAVGDLLVIVFCVPFTSIIYTTKSYPWGEFICVLSEVVKDISTGVSVFTLTALSAERYCVIVNPIGRHMSSKPTTFITAIAIWVLSFVLTIPDMLHTSVRLQENTTVEACTPFENINSTYAKGLVLFRFLAYYAIPLCIIGFFYILMARNLLLSVINLPGERGQAQSNQIKARKKVAKIVLAFVIIFIICFLPLHTFMLWFFFCPTAFDDYNEFWNALKIVGFCLVFCNSCVNPIALYFISKAFRKYFNHYLFCCTNANLLDDVKLTTVNSSFSRRQNSVLTSHCTISQLDETW